MVFSVIVLVLHAALKLMSDLYITVIVCNPVNMAPLHDTKSDW